jgi:cellulose synthase/poly-beta-1,6-N-acetylglucosamine synthase-like glycosyltransferase
LGLSCGLFGTGMAFRRDVIENHGWDSYTLAEDVEYFMKLTSHGIKVEFAPEAVLRAQMPTTLKGAKSQNLRWERGRLSMAKTYGIPYVIKGLLKGNLVMADAGIQQIIPPVSVSALSVVLFAIASAFTGSYTLIGLSIAMLAAMFTHLVLGLVLARAPGRVYKAFLYAPLFVAWKLVVYIEAMLPKRMSWERTQRS